jgi:hypothetical protein
VDPDGNHLTLALKRRADKEIEIENMKCEFCGEESATYLALPPDRKVRACARCAPLCSNLFTFENNRDHAREVMIGQHQDEPRRKLLELENHDITVFLSDSLEIVALEVESKRDRRLVKWREEGFAKAFLINNVGRSYSNRDELIPCAGFDVASLKNDIEISRNNLQPRFDVAGAACLKKLMLLSSSNLMT